MANKKQSGFGKWASSRKGQQVIICAAFAIIPLLLLLVFTYIPFGEMVKFSFYKMKYTTPVEKREFVGLANYIDVFTRKDCFGALKLSLYYIVGALVQLVLALFLATLLSFKVKGGNLFKGCILNSRITWFFASAYKALKDPKLLDEAAHGYEFLKEYCIDREYGGIYWSMNYDGSPKDTTKHTYNQAFSIYALSAYYEASGDSEALDLALQLFHTIEEKCTDEGGYLEAFTREFKPESNDKLSENGVLAERTMNTLLHALEAYTELYKVSKDSKVKERLKWLLDVFADKVYNPELKRQEVFFDKDYNSLIDLYSYGHDIETSWLLDRATEVLGEAEYTEKITKITDILAEQIYEIAFDGHSVLTECEKGVPYTVRVWWVQAESIVGFINAYQKSGDKKYYEAAEKVWEYIKEYFIDKRPGSEWFWDLNADGTPRVGRPIVEPWKCPYHNGRMCLEIMNRLADGK